MIPDILLLHLPVIGVFPGLLLTRRLIRRGPGSGGVRARLAGRGPQSRGHSDGHSDGQTAGQNIKHSAQHSGKEPQGIPPPQRARPAPGVCAAHAGVHVP